MSTSAGQRLWTADYVLTLFGTIGFFGSFFYLLSVLPEYVDSIGGAKWQIGLIVGGFGIVPLFIRPLVGRWSDRGRRKLLMRAGLLFSAGALVLMVFSEDVASLFLLRVVQGIGVAMYPTAAVSLVTEVTPVARRGEGLGFFGMSTGVAQMLAPAAGVAVAGIWGFDAVFLIAAATAGLTLFIVQPVREPQVRRESTGGLSNLIPREAIFPMLVFLSVTFSFSAAATFLPLLGNERDLGNVGLFFFFGGMGSLLIRPLAGRISDRVGRVAVVAPGLVTMMVSMWLLALADSPPLMLFAGFASGIGLGAAHTGLLALAIDRVSSTERGRATAVVQMAWDIGGLTGGLLLGLLATVLGVAAVYWVAGLIVLVALVSLLSAQVGRISSGSLSEIEVRDRIEPGS